MKAFKLETWLYSTFQELDDRGKFDERLAKMKIPNTANFLCKILIDNKNIDANIWIFQIPFSQWRGRLWKKLFWVFFWRWSHLSLPKISTLTDPPFTFFAHISLIFDKYQMAIFFIEYLGSLRPVLTSLMCIWSKLSKN